jgi:hypothetical protein
MLLDSVLNQHLQNVKACLSHLLKSRCQDADGSSNLNPVDASCVEERCNLSVYLTYPIYDFSYTSVNIRSGR